MTTADSPRIRSEPARIISVMSVTKLLPGTCGNGLSSAGPQSVIWIAGKGRGFARDLYRRRSWRLDQCGPRHKKTPGPSARIRAITDTATEVQSNLPSLRASSPRAQTPDDHPLDPAPMPEPFAHRGYRSHLTGLVAVVASPGTAAGTPRRLAVPRASSGSTARSADRPDAWAFR